jgi:hypothetical protein
MTSPRRLVAPASACASPVCIGSSRLYEQALQRVGLTQPQLEVLAGLITAAGPVKADGPGREPDGGAVHHQPESRPHAKQRLGRRGRDLGHGTSDACHDYRRRHSRVVSAGTAWRRAPAGPARALGAGAASVLDQQLGLAAAAPASGSNAETPGPGQQSTSRESPRHLGGRADAGRADAGFRHVPDCGHPVGGWHAWR